MELPDGRTVGAADNRRRDSYKRKESGDSVMSFNFATLDEDDVYVPPPEMIMACGKIDDTVIVDTHIKDTVLRKVADAMALHNLGEETYHRHLNNDKERVQDTHTRKKNKHRQQHSGTLQDQHGFTGATEKNEDTEQRGEGTGESPDAREQRKTGEEERSSNNSFVLPQTRTSHNTPPNRRSTEADKSNTTNRSVFHFLSHHDKTHNEVLRSISFQLGAHRDSNGHIVSEKTYNRNSIKLTSNVHNKQRFLKNNLGGIDEEEEVDNDGPSNFNATECGASKKYDASKYDAAGNTPRKRASVKKHGRAAWNDDCRVCCCSYGSFRDCCFLVEDLETCSDIRCCIKEHECQPNAMIKIPLNINYTTLDDPSASVHCCCCVNPRLSEW